MPRSDQNITPGDAGESNFLFINTDATSDSFKLHEENSLRVRRHAAMRSLAAAREAKKRSLRQRPTIVGWASTPMSRVDRGHGSETDSAQRETGKEILQLRSDNTDGLQQSSRTGQEDARTRALVPKLPKALCSQNDAVDPFGTTALRVDRWTHSVVQYYAYKMIPDCFISESRAYRPLPEHFSAAISARIQGCLANELHMYSMMASCSSRMRRFECIATESRRTSPEFYVDKAITALRRQLSTNAASIDTFTFLDIISLAVAEAFMHNHEAAATHLRLIKHLGTLMGKSKRFEPFLLELFFVGDTNVGLEANTVPILPLEWIGWEEESLPAQRMAEVLELAMIEDQFPALEPGNLPGWDDEFFSADILVIVNDLKVYVQAAQWVWHQPQSMPGDRKWILLRGLGLLHRLLSLKDMIPLFSPEPRVEECCRISLLILIHAILGHARARQFMKVWAPRFKDALLLSNCQKTTAEENPWLKRPKIFLWALSAGLFMAEGTEEELWFLGEAATAAKMVKTSSGKAYEGFIKTLYFLDDETRDSFLQLSKVLEWQQRKSVADRTLPEGHVWELPENHPGLTGLTVET